MRISAWSITGIAFISLGRLCAHEPASLPAFEVASIKPSQGGPAGLFTYPGGRIVANLVTLEYMIEQALDVQPFQVSGGPGWIRDDRYTIEARPPASSESSKVNPSNFKQPPNSEQRQMLQTLLTDRFQLKFHRETREGQVYILARGNRELKLQGAKNKDEYPWAGSIAGGSISGDGLAGTDISMPQLAERLAPYLGHPVLDQTGLTGSFDFRFEYASDDPHPSLSPRLSPPCRGMG